MNWDNPPEIKGRREKERDLFFDGVWTNTGTMTEYTRLTKTMTPVNSSAIKIDVRKELQVAFAKAAPVELDQPMQPDAPVDVPALSPDAAPKAAELTERPPVSPAAPANKLPGRLVAIGAILFVLAVIVFIAFA
jgi:hypothetical protein